MAKFQVQAMNTAGQAVESEIDAPTLQDALVKIRSQGQFPTQVRQAVTKQRSRNRGQPTRMSAIVLSRVSTRALTEFTQQLSILQDAGLPILRSLKILEQQEKKGMLKSVLNAVAQSVESGSTLSEAMGMHPRAFDRLYVNMVQAGETGGVLELILQRLAEFMEKAQRLRRRIIGAMIYPCVVIAVAMIIVTGIMMFVVPKFRDIFRDFQAALPTLTVDLMATADFIANRFGWAMILGSPLALWMVTKWIGKSRAGRRFLDIVKLRLPVVGRIVRKTSVARFTRTLGTLLAAGVPILDAVIIARDTVGNSVFESALQTAHDAIRAGESFASRLRSSKICDSLVANMIDVGEETGELDKMLLKIADTYDEQVDVLVGSLVSLLEPIMVVTLGGIVGTIVVALFMPLVTIIQKMTNPN